MGQECLDWRLEADGGELIRALLFNPALSATAAVHQQPYQTQFNAQRSVFSVFEYENLMHRSQLSMSRSHLHALEVALDSQQLNLRGKSQRILTDTESAVRLHPFHILLYSSLPMSCSCPIPLLVVLFPTLPLLEHLGNSYSHLPISSTTIPDHCSSCTGVSLTAIAIPCG